MIFGNWRPAGALGAAPLGFSTALAFPVAVSPPQAATLFQALPLRLDADRRGRRDRAHSAPEADGKP